MHKESIATQIKEHVDFVTAVLVLANGTVPRITVGTDYALSTLSTIFGESLASNIAFMFTNVLSPLHWNFCGDTVPPLLKDAPHFILNNPITLQKKYLKLKDVPNMKKGMVKLRKEVEDGEENALEMLVDLFDWLDGLEPRPTSEIVPLLKKSQNCTTRTTDTPASMDHSEAKAKVSAVSRSSGIHLLFEPYPHREQNINQKPAASLNLEQMYVGTGEKEVSRAPMGRMRGNFVEMKRRLGLLRMAEEKVQEGIRKVKRTLSASRGKY